MNRVANQLDTGHRMRSHALSVPPPVASKFDVFADALAVASRAKRPLYIEFGVFEGASILEWAARVPLQDASFVGFDSFEGLPEDWSHTYCQGVFATGGKIPATDDQRVSFVKGWFEDTVPKFEPPPHDLLVVNIDGDLYSSAVTCLAWTAAHLKVGDFLYFDEFQDRLHEGRAFGEFVGETGFRFETIAATHGLEKILFRRIS